MARWGTALLLSSACVVAFAQRAPSPDDPKAVVAETQQPAKKQGMVRIGGVTWKCSSKVCVATSKRASTGVNTCQALAEQVGSLARFGRVERPMPSYDLALCNVRAQIKLAKLEQQRADAEAARVRRLPSRPQPAVPAQPAPEVSAPRSLPAAPAKPVARRAPPPVVEASPIAPSYRPPVFSIRVAQLAVVGRGDMGTGTVEAPAKMEPGAAEGMAAEPVPEQSAATAVERTQPAPVAVPGLAIVGQGRMRERVPGTYLTVTVDKLELIGKREGEE